MTFLDFFDPILRAITSITVDDLPGAEMRQQLTFAGDVARGDTGQRVKLVQELISLEQTSIACDGDFGPATERAVERYQSAKVLPVTGVVDQVTWNALILPILHVHRPISDPSLDFGDLVVSVAYQHLAAHPREVGGPNEGPWVRLYMSGIDGAHRLWCAGFVFYILEQAARERGVTLPIARTFSCDQLARRARQANIFISENQLDGLDEDEIERLIQPGSVFLKRKTATDWTHTGLVVSVSGGAVDTIEGNTNDEGVREGYEVCRRVRSFRSLDFVAMDV